MIATLLIKLIAWHHIKSAERAIRKAYQHGIAGNAWKHAWWTRVAMTRIARFERLRSHYPMPVLDVLEVVQRKHDRQILSR